MFSKIVALSALLTAVKTAYVSHGHGVSFQSIVRHDERAQYTAPVADYTVPVTHYAAPIAEYTTSGANYNGYDNYANPKYNYAYSMVDPQMDRYYSRAQSVDFLHKMEYTANYNGFTAVRNSATSLEPAPIYEEDDDLY